MGSERIRKFLIVSSHLGWFIEILLAAFIAPDRETAIEGRQGHHAICFTQRDSVARKDVPRKVEPVIFTKYYPAIIIIFPHSDLLWPNASIGGESMAGHHETFKIRIPLWAYQL
jgi:hypothetical protein